ncbi:NUDIX domain-containing protein [Cytobacillus spongiae]|jgi:isopentenyldiphosphate isomerase|uniref:NUDIX hydrolase n=1 Tax=Cytobacillus spongiae TaxID=2901381 RepID=UPI001F205056|nr:NUDIX domain-containing protein [Cytobacillus spongiae]UII56391.1 NUDIX domain-containing protein [Cytobacillus spongiae]
MVEEYFKIFDEDRNEIGVASRTDVHKLGYWHETFHCWFVSQHDERDSIYLQLRSDTKKDYPSLLDITVAGHLSAEEKVEDGIREIQEEVGMDLPFQELESLGVLEYCVVQEGFIDKELANVFLYKSKHRLDTFMVQPDEVSGVVSTGFSDFCELWLGDRESVVVEGFIVDSEGKRRIYSKEVTRNDFVPHGIPFYKQVIQKIKERL